MPYDLFISYSRRDNKQGRVAQFVEHIKREFTRFAGRDLTPFFDQQDILGMEDWRQKILQGLRESRLMLACLSPAYLTSQYCEWEFVEYVKYEIGHLHGYNGVAPIYFVEVPGWKDKGFEQQCAAWVAELRKRQHFDLRPWYEFGEAALHETVVQERMRSLTEQIATTIKRGERAENALGNVDAHNPHFIGRTAGLRKLREIFVTPGHIGVVTAVKGLGGVGKTALAIEYAHAFADEYGGGRWQVRCANKDDLRLALAELAAPIGFEFTGDEKKDADLQFERVRRELKKLADAHEPHHCLLLLDNVDRAAMLDPAQVARLNGGDWLHVLATTRLGENELHGVHRDRSFLAIDELAPEEALALIESYQPGGHFHSEAESGAAREIVQLLGCFTLAVESAAVYLGQFANDVTCVTFLARLKKEGLEALDIATSQSSEGVLHGEKRVAVTLGPTLERLSPSDKLVLGYAALLPPDHIVLEWIRPLIAEEFPETGKDTEPGYPDPWKNIIRRLLSLGLFRVTAVIGPDGQPQVVRTHRILSALLRKRIGSDIERRSEKVYDRIKARSDELFPKWHQNRWEIAPLVAFAQESLAAQEYGAELPDILHVVGNVGYLLRKWGDYAAAEPFSKRAFEGCERVLGPANPITLNCLESLARLLRDKGDYAPAEQLSRRAVEVRAKLLGREHPSTLRSAATLGLLLQDKGDNESALRLFEQILEAGDRVLGPEHADTLSYVNNLAISLSRKGDYEQAQPLYERVLAAHERLLAREDPKILEALNNLAMFLWRKGDYNAAQPLIERSLAASEKVLGAEHPTTLVIVNNLAALLYKKRDFVGAQLLYERALKSRELTLGPDHPSTLNSIDGLACSLASQGHCEAAKPLYELALERNERTLGPMHPSTLQTLGNLATLCSNMGRFEESTRLRQRIEDAKKRGQKLEQPLQVTNEEGLPLRKIGFIRHAESVETKRAETSGKYYGEGHAITIDCRNDLAITLIMLGKLEEARQILAAIWRLNAPPHANTTPRIAFLRYVIALLENQPDTPFLGQVKTLLTGSELPVASDVAVPWDIAYFIEYLRSKLNEHNAQFLTAVVAAMNDRAKLSDIERFPEWQNQSPVPLNVPWPD
jgi:tetratricopeptide (TPR) repeat protein